MVAAGVVLSCQIVYLPGEADPADAAEYLIPRQATSPRRPSPRRSAGRAVAVS
jgi:hypothetical protein